jgi:hypothetical protein
VSHVKEAITWAHHDEWARMLCAALTWHFGDLDGLHRVGTLIRELHDLCEGCRPPHDARWDVVIQPDRADLVCHNDLASCRQTVHMAFVSHPVTTPPPTSASYECASQLLALIASMAWRRSPGSGSAAVMTWSCATAFMACQLSKPFTEPTLQMTSFVEQLRSECIAAYSDFSGAISDFRGGQFRGPVEVVASQAENRHERCGHVNLQWPRAGGLIWPRTAATDVAECIRGPEASWEKLPAWLSASAT